MGAVANQSEQITPSSTPRQQTKEDIGRESTTDGSELTTGSTRGDTTWTSKADESTTAASCIATGEEEENTYTNKDLTISPKKTQQGKANVRIQAMKAATKPVINSISLDKLETAVLIKKADGMPDVQLKDFVVTHEIGRGSFGQVYLAKLETGQSPDRLFAIKSVRKDKLAESESAMKSAILECQVCFLGNHPNLCSMDYFFSTQERLYFVMPFMAGGNLREALQAQQPPKGGAKRFSDEEQEKLIICQILLGVQQLHNADIMHRDIKLENVAIDSNGYIKIIDFGTARVLRNGQQACTQCGTISYMAPEVIGGKMYNKQADFWSIGVVAYELMFGVVPFSDLIPHRLAQKITQQDLAIPNQARIPHSDAFRDFLRALLHKEPSDRPEFAAEILAHPWFSSLDITDVHNQTIVSEQRLNVTDSSKAINMKKIVKGKSYENKLSSQQMELIAQKEHLFAQFEQI